MQKPVEMNFLDSKKSRKISLKTLNRGTDVNIIFDWTNFECMLFWGCTKLNSSLYFSNQTNSIANSEGMFILPKRRKFSKRNLKI